MPDNEYRVGTLLDRYRATISWYKLLRVTETDATCAHHWFFNQRNHFTLRKNRPQPINCAACNEIWSVEGFECFTRKTTCS